VRRDLQCLRFGNGTVRWSCCDGVQKRDFTFIQGGDLTLFYPFTPSGCDNTGPRICLPSAGACPATCAFAMREDAVYTSALAVPARKARRGMPPQGAVGRGSACSAAKACSAGSRRRCEPQSLKSLTSGPDIPPRLRDAFLYPAHCNDGSPPCCGRVHRR
jgi:hypothetical protein